MIAYVSIALLVRSPALAVAEVVEAEGGGEREGEREREREGERVHILK